MHSTSTGLWLIGVGSILLVIAVVLSTPDAAKGYRFKVIDTALKERSVYGLQVTGLLFAAVGSLVVALSQTIDLGVILATGVALVVCFDVVFAWLLRRYRREKLDQMQTYAASGGEVMTNARAVEQLAIARRCATWR